MTKELRTLVQVSTTEHDLDASPVDDRAAEDEVAEVDALDDDELDAVDVDVPARAQDIDIAVDADDDDDLETVFDDLDDIEPADDELDAVDVDVPARAQDIDIAVDADDVDDLDDLDDDDDAFDTDGDIDERLGRFDAFLTEAQSEPAENADADPSYQLPMIVIATELDDDAPLDELDDVEAFEGVAGFEGVEGLADDRQPVDPDDLEVSEDVLEELRRANIDGPTVALLPHDDSLPHRRLKRSPEYDPAPMPIPLTLPRMLGRKPRVRRVTRVVRHVDPWSVFKIAIIANLLIYVIVLVAGVLLWNVAYATGTVDNVERFFESFGWSSFEFNGGEIYHSGWTGGLFLVIGFTGLAVLAATMFNLITDLVGGMRFTVLEEEVVETRASPMRRFVVRRSEPEIPLVSNDESGQIIREAVVDDSTGYIRPG